MKYHKRKGEPQKKYKYTHKCYYSPEELPDYIHKFKGSGSGFDFTGRIWKSYDSGLPKEDPFRTVSKRFNNFLLHRHLKGELTAKLPLHKQGKLTVIYVDFSESEESTEFLRIYDTLVKSLRRQPLLVEVNHEEQIFRMFYKFKEILPTFAWDKWASKMKEHCSAYSIEVVTPHREDEGLDRRWVVLPGAKTLWPITLVPTYGYNKHSFHSAFTPITGNPKQIAEAFYSSKPAYGPQVIKKLELRGIEHPEREEVRKEIPTPDFNYGSGTRHTMQPKIALWTIFKYGYDYGEFERLCREFDNGSKDMQKTRGTTQMKYIWDWACNVYDENKATSPTTFTSSPLSSTGSVISGEVAKHYNPMIRDIAGKTIYDNILWENRQVSWWYSPRFEFRSELRENLRSSLVPLARLLNMGGKDTGAFVDNALRFYALIFENAEWHKRQRKNPNYQEKYQSQLDDAFNEAPVLSKQNRHDMCKAFSISQPDAIWRLLKIAGLVSIVEHPSGSSYSYRGKIRYAQHYRTPGNNLDRYARWLFQVVRAAVDGNEGRFNTLWESVSKSLMGQKAKSRNLKSLYSLLNPLILVSSNSNTYTSKGSNLLRHNICVKYENELVGAVGRASEKPPPV